MNQESRVSFFWEKGALCLLFLYFMILWMVEFIFRRDYPDSLDYYFLITHIALFSLSLWLLTKEFWGKGPQRLSFFKILWVLILLGLYLYVLKLKFDEKVIWLDEHVQFLFGSHIIPSNVIERAFHQQQAPLDYMLMGYAKTYFGIKAFAVKFHAMLFGAGTLLIIPSLVKSYLGRIQGVGVSSFFILFSPFFLNYALEGRPISITLFAASFFFMFLGRFLIEKKDMFWLGLSGVFLLSTTSLQPQLFILTSFAMGTLIYWRKIKLKLLFLGVGLALWRLPLDYRIFMNTKRQRVFLEEIPSWWQLILNIGERILYFVQQNNELQYIGFSLGFFTLLWGLYKEKERKSVFLLSVPLVFFSLFSLIWDFNINSVLNPRYMICAMAPLFVFLGLLEQRVRNHSKRMSWFFLGTVIVSGLYLVDRPIAEYSKNAVRPDWDRAYGYVGKVIEPGDVVLHVAFAGIGDFRGQGHVGAIFYGNENVRLGLLDYLKNRNWEAPNVVYFDEGRDYLKESGKIILLLNKHEQKPRFWEHHYPGLITEEYFYGITVLVFEKKGSLYETFQSVFESLLKKHGVNERTMGFLEALIYMENKYGTKNKLRSYIDLYKTIRIENELNRRGFDIGKEEELKKRVETFERLYSTWSSK